MSGVNDPIVKHKKVLADAIVYYANKRTVIRIDQLVYTKGMVFWHGDRWVSYTGKPADVDNGGLAAAA